MRIIVAFIYCAIFCIIIFIAFKPKISLAMEVLDIISLNANEDFATKDIKINTEKKRLTSYPEYGTKYGTLEIPSLGLNFNLYYGDSLDILVYGIGHSSGSYFPGEGGSIIMMGHNYAGILKTLPELQMGEDIIITTSYGKFTYKADYTKIVYYENTHELPIQEDEEILMLYTCWPVDGFGHSVDRYVVFANLVDQEIF